MNSRSAKGLTKHADFILLDMICLQVSFVIAYWFFREFSNPYDNDAYQYQAVVFLTAQLVYIIFVGNYSGILRRGKFDEFIAVIKQIGYTLLIALVFLFVVHRTSVVSRLQFGGTTLLFIVIDWSARLLNRYRILVNKEKKRSLALITTSDLMPDVMKKIGSDHMYFVSGIFLLDDKPDSDFYEDIPLYQFGGGNMEKFIRQWIDEIVIMPPVGGKYYDELNEFIRTTIDMGIRINLKLSIDMGPSISYLEMRKIGQQKLISASLKVTTPQELRMKRIMDIAVSIIGCICTGIIALIFGPIICIKSPGPLFFVQDRIGRNGKKFKMYKFRTMYPDAEERKQSLMEQNKMSGEMMFKMDDDPRIIGSEKKDRKGRPKGIGNFMRKYSFDEFPQFFNVLCGDMSVVGWRPCTQSEWEKYNLKDRIRASMKPGITGMWQVSGRSGVTDFDEVVRLDREYLENWSIGIDVRIMIKTIWVVISGKGAT